jgi:hypothetical protein
MRLFRQRRGETWGPAVERLLRELSVVARGDPTPLTPFKAMRERRAAQAADIIAIESERAEKVAPPKDTMNSKTARRDPAPLGRVAPVM